MFKILEQNGIDNENIDGAAFNNFSAGNRDGIIKDVLNECELSSTGNIISVAAGEIILHGFRVKITAAETLSAASAPAARTEYQIVAQVTLSDNHAVAFTLFFQLPQALVQNPMFDTDLGTYQAELGRFYQETDGAISGLRRTLPVIYADSERYAEEAKAAAEQAQAAAEEAQEGAAQAKLDIPLSPEQTGVAITGENTLAGASVSVALASKNLFNLNLASIAGSGSVINRTENTITIKNPDNGSYRAACFELPTSIIGKIITVSGTWSVSGNNNGGVRAQWITPTGIAIGPVCFETYVSGEQKSGVVPEMPSGADRFVLFLYSNSDGSATADDNTTYTDVQVELGEIATPYTPYIADGTSVNVTACGGNIYNGETPPSGSNGSFLEDGYTFTRTTTGQTSNISFGTGKIYAATQGKYVTFSCNVDSENPHVGIQYSYGSSQDTINGKFVGDRWVVTAYIKYGTTPINHWRVFIGETDEQTKVLSNICINIGDTPIPFETYNGITQSATVGQLLQVDQYDKITTVFADNIGVTVSAAFKQSTRYELDTKPVSLAGTYAERPTGTYPYVVLYTATDRSGETYRLEANTDGSVSANWVQINGIYQHNIVMSQATGPFFSVTIRSQDNYAYAFSRLIEWFNGKGLNVQGKDYSDVAGAFKNDSGVLHIISHMRANGSGLQVSGVNITTGNVADFTINEVATCTDTVITI